jgi:dinuclear metal center YbgI/SA1388 family protein
MTINELIQHIETIAPPCYQEGYDNSGLIVGNADTPITNVLLCLDSTEAIIDEAISKNCNLVIAHHPIVFSGLKRLTGKTYIERTIIKAIQHGIAIYACHTNLDNIQQGVNGKIAQLLDLVNPRILQPKKVLRKLYVFVPVPLADTLKSRLLGLGAGQTGVWTNLSHAAVGAGSSNTAYGAEVKLEVIFHEALQPQIVQVLHTFSPQQPLPYDIVQLQNTHEQVGSGMIGQLAKPMSEQAFLKHLKSVMKVGCIKYTALLGKSIKTVALCGGAGGFLLSSAIAQGADIFITADYKYHEFFDANGKIVIADIGHYESEQFTMELFRELISEKITNFALHLAETNTNPVNYL